ncbi:GNAT family N-acetyltransferase [Paenibacillus sp. FSL H7-0326]|uniref:GNAT family N-acetyltransferase n=1 Tax=Paenibacillus sp. FSL H7-0326 TaxID=1921144 RepID=UPI00273EC92D|nr:GNAT family N-acetyltransferase [Paenibacillus sp. FSL H7-0326]
MYYGDRQIGFARIITDWATVYYLCDVFIDEEYRGRGLGKKLIEVIIEEYEGMMGLLGTLDGHGLYEKYGFMKNTERFMNRRPH